MEAWEPLMLTLRKGDFSDYLANDGGLHLCSKKLRDILNKAKADCDEVQWLPAIVRSETGEEREYFILHLPQPYEVLDKDKTVYGPLDSIIKPMISIKLAEKHHVFTIWGREGVSVFVSGQVKKSIQSAKCPGVIFEKAAATD